MTLVQSIRESIQNCTQLTSPFFTHGRNADTTLDAAKEQNIGTLVYLEPINKTGNMTDGGKTAVITIGFLTQDEPDSAHDEELNEADTLSMEEKLANMETESVAWLDYFFSNYKFGMLGNYQMQPVYRFKNVMTGVLLTFTIIEPKQC